MIYLSIIASIIVLGVAAMVWWHHDAVLEGRAECQKKVADAVALQRIQDVQSSQDVINELNQDKARLQAQVDAKPPPPIRNVCGRLRYVDREVPAGGSAPSAQPSQPPNAGVDRGVPAGGGGGDVGEGVLAISNSGKVLAIYYRRLYEWALRTRENDSGQR